MHRTTSNRWSRRANDVPEKDAPAEQEATPETIDPKKVQADVVRLLANEKFPLNDINGYYVRQRLELLKRLGDISNDRCTAEWAEDLAINKEFNEDFGPKFMEYINYTKTEQLNVCSDVMQLILQEYAQEGGNVEAGRLREKVERETPAELGAGSTGGASWAADSTRSAASAATSFALEKKPSHIPSSQILHGLLAYIKGDQLKVTSSLIKKNRDLNSKTELGRKLDHILAECKQVNAKLEPALAIGDLIKQVDPLVYDVNDRLKEKMSEARICNHLKYFNDKARDTLFKMLEASKASKI